MGGGDGCTTGAGCTMSSSANGAKISNSAKACIVGGWKSAASPRAEPRSTVTDDADVLMI